MPHKYLVKEFQEIAYSVGEPKALMQHISQRIHAHIPRYNWVGFYLLDPTDHGALVLGPHTGSFTPNPTIAVDHGLCGAAFCDRQMIVADNVAEDRRYVCVSDIVKSHISVPLMAGVQAVGVFSVESYFIGTFKPAVEWEFVQNCAGIVSRCAERAEGLPFSASIGERTMRVPVTSHAYQGHRA